LSRDRPSHAHPINNSKRSRQFILSKVTIFSNLYILHPVSISACKVKNIKLTSITIYAISIIISYFIENVMFQASWRQSFLQQHRQHARYSTQEEVDTSRFRIGKRHYYRNISPCSSLVTSKHLPTLAHVTNLQGYSRPFVVDSRIHH
jgi:hypothetical protein